MTTKTLKNFQFLASEKTDWKEFIAGAWIMGLIVAAIALSL